MGRYGVTQEDVFSACRKLNEEGGQQQLTTENVRNELKTGSYTTVLRYLNKFKAQEESEKKQGGEPIEISATPEALKNELMSFADALWGKASNLIRPELELLKKSRDETQLLFSEKAIEFDELLSETKKLEEENEKIKSDLSSLQEASIKQSQELETQKLLFAGTEQEKKNYLERAIHAEQALEVKNQEVKKMADKVEEAQDEIRKLLERAITAEKELQFSNRK
jgi:hypothetical protein